MVDPFYSIKGVSMKLFIVSMLMLSSVSAFANCPELAGKYLCAEEAADEMSIGSRNVFLAYGSLFKSYAFGTEKEAYLYEMNSWNPAISMNGDIDQKVKTIALCKDSVLTLRNEVTETVEDISLSMVQDWEVRAIEG